MSMYQHDAFLTDHLAVSAQSWAEGFRSAHGLEQDRAPEGMDPVSWQTFQALDQLAWQIVTASREFGASMGNPAEVLDTLKRDHAVDLESSDFFVQAMEVHLVEELEDELDRMRRRALKLVRYLVDAKAERARAYLARVGACYLRGMPTETVIMCGAVLDAALQEAIADQDVKAAGIRCGKYVSMGNRIE